MTFSCKKSFQSSTGAVLHTLRYDANGNMTEGLNGKVMTYDGENRPLTVTYQGETTCYTYGPDGTRWAKIERCGTADPLVTRYVGSAEIRAPGTAGEAILDYLHANIRLTDGGAALGGSTEYLFQDQLGSINRIVYADGAEVETRAYAPFGEMIEQ